MKSHEKTKENVAEMLHMGMPVRIDRHHKREGRVSSGNRRNKVGEQLLKANEDNG